MSAVARIATLSAALALHGCSDSWLARTYCSDDPVCAKYTCEDGFGPDHCRRWSNYCAENAADLRCEGIEAWRNRHGVAVEELEAEAEAEAGIRAEAKAEAEAEAKAEAEAGAGAGAEAEAGADEEAQAGADEDTGR